MSAHVLSQREEAAQQIARCQRLHEQLVAARDELLHECAVEELLDRRVDSHVAAVGHLPMRHVRPPRRETRAA